MLSQLLHHTVRTPLLPRSTLSIISRPRSSYATSASATTNPTSSSSSSTTTTSPTSSTAAPTSSPQSPSQSQPQQEQEQQQQQQQRQQSPKAQFKSTEPTDEEIRQRLEEISGEGGEAGLELEGGKPVAMKRGVRENMFRVI